MNNPRFPSFCLYYIRKAGISQMCDKVAGSSPKGSRKGAMVKGGCFLPLKTRKVLENQGLFVLGCKIVAPFWSRLWDSNPQPADYKSAALPIELSRQDKLCVTENWRPG